MSDTEVGGIKGYLLLDDSDWDAKIDQAIAKAQELQRVDPNVRVTAETDKAQADLDAVEATVRELGAQSATIDVNVRSSSSGASGADAVAAAEAKLAAATTASDLATQRAELSQMRLNALRESGSASDIQIASAELALASATARADAAAQKAWIAEDALTAAREDAAAAAAAESVAADEEAAANTAAGAAAGGASNQTMLMAGAIAAVISLLGPAAAATVAIGGGFLGMASAGVLAVVGIKNAMTDGTQVGQQYSAGLKDLKGDLDELGSTAAINMLGAFQQAEQTIGGDLPELNSNVAILSGYLGRSGNNLLDGVVNGLETAEPLFEEGAALIERWSQGFDRWASGGGLQSFVSYAQAELPRVATSIEDLGDDVVILTQELEPLGNAIQDIGYGAHSILQIGQAFESWKQSLSGSGMWSTGLKTLLDSAGKALNPVQQVEGAFQQLQPLIDKLTGSTQQQATATQVASAATTASANSMGVSAKAYQAAKEAADQQASSTRSSTLAMQMEDDAAGLLNNALTILNGGALNVMQAQTGVASATNSVIDSMKQNGKAIDGNSEAAVANQQAIQQVVTAADQLANAQATASGSTAAGVKAYTDQKAALEATMRAAGDLTPAMQAYIDKAFDVSNLKVKPTKLDVDSGAAMAAIKALQGDIAATPKLHTSQMDAEVAAARTNIANLKGDLANVPASQRTTVQAEIAQAEANLQALIAKINAVPKSFSVQGTVTTIELTQQGSAAKLAKAHGGTIQAFAMGGTSGTVSGAVGSAISDSLVTRLGIGEEVVQTSSANYPGMRSLLKSINADPKATAAALSSGGGPQTVVVELVDRTTGGASEFVDARVRVATKRQQKAAAVASIGGRVL